MPLYSLDDRRIKVPADGRYWVADTATVIGDVTLEEDVSIWFNVVIRGDNEPMRIGARTNIQDGCVLHSDPGYPLSIGADCTIGHMAMLHGCTIGAGALIGIGAIVLNGARIGEGSLIAAGALVGERKEIPPGSLVFGSPGKVVRQLTADEQARMRHGAEHYITNSRRFAKGMKRQD